MKPINLHTKIFLDSGDPKDTEAMFKILGFLDGQTTNPTYFAKSSQVQEHLRTVGKYKPEELLESYRSNIIAIEKIIPQGSLSVEVYADKNTSAETMLAQARQMFKWTPNAYIKFPIIPEGMKAAEQALNEGMRVNMTLCFNQEQAAAVYAMSRGAQKGNVYVSPFIGRHTDAGRQGLDLIRNIVRMFSQGDGHVEVLAASLRHIDQFYAVLQAKADIITAGSKYLQQWSSEGLKVPGNEFSYNPEGFEPIPYIEYDLSRPWTDFNIQNEMTDRGLEQFAADWNALIA